MTKLIWTIAAAALAATGAGAILDTVFPLAGEGWMEDLFDVFGDDDEL